MTSPDQRADDGDRNDAIKLVEAALKSGRIIEADRDRRVDSLHQAQTMQDIDIIVRDLRIGTPQMAGATVTATPYAQPGQQPWPPVNYGPAAGQPSEAVQIAGKTARRIGGVIIAVVLISFVIPIAGVAIALFSARDSFPGPFAEPADETTYLPGQEPAEGGVNLHTVGGMEDLNDALAEQTGATTVYQAVLYPRYAVLEVPVSGGTGRYQNFYWDGEELAAQDSRGTTTYETFEMTEIDPELIIRLLEKVRNAIDDPTSWYVVISAPPNIEPQIGAYASNEFSETAYVVATFDGKIIYKQFPESS